MQWAIMHYEDPALICKYKLLFKVGQHFTLLTCELILSRLCPDLALVFGFAADVLLCLPGCVVLPTTCGAACDGAGLTSEVFEP